MKVNEESVRDAIRKSMTLYVVTDRTWLGTHRLEDQVEEILKAGATFLQLREKDMDFDSFVEEAKQIKEIADRHNVPFVINDNVDVALAVGADGIHIGQSDINVKDARGIIGKDKILGVSVQTVKQALLAQESGADYLGVGAVFSTSTKIDADVISFETLKEICQCVNIPVVAIGGIDESNIFKLKHSGIDGVAVVSAIFARPDVAVATKELLNQAKELFT